MSVWNRIKYNNTGRKEWWGWGKGWPALLLCPDIDDR